MKNYYAILGVSQKATPEEIKAAYRTNAKRYHPDMNPGNESFALRFKEINEANDVLSDPKKRAEYDAELANPQKAQAKAQSQGGGFKQSTGSSAQAQFQAQFQAQVTQLQSQFTEQVKKLHEQYAEQIKKLHEQYGEQLNMLRKQCNERIELTRKTYADQNERQRKEANDLLEDAKKKFYENGYQQGALDAQRTSRITIEDLKQKNADLNNQVIQAGAMAASGGAVPDAYKKMLADAAERNARISELEQQIKTLKEYEVSIKRGEAQAQLSARQLNTENQRLQGEIKAARDEALKHEQDLDLFKQEIETLRKISQEREDSIKQLNEELELLRGGSFAESAAETADDEEEIRKYEKAQRAKAKGTHYATLGLFLTAIPEEIGIAYAKTEARFKERGATDEKMESIRQAYNILKNADTKYEYDTFIGNFEDDDSLVEVLQ